MTRIVHISDLHFELPSGRSPEVADILAADAEQILSLHPDLVVVTGDLTEHGSARRDELVLARDWLADLRVPTLVVPGNHDLGANAHRGALHPEHERWDPVVLPETNYGSILGPSPLTAITLPEVSVVGVALREGDPDGSLARLKTFLSSHPEPVLLFGHYPIVAARDIKPAIEFGSDEYVPTSSSELAGIVAAHPNVRLYGCGHVHVASVTALANAAVQVTAGSLGRGAAYFYLYEIDDVSMRFEVCSGRGPSTFWSHDEVPLPRDFHRGHAREHSGIVNLIASEHASAALQSVADKKELT